MVRERRCEEKRWVADCCRWVEQRQPCRVGLSVRVAVCIGQADGRYRTPELPVILVVPTTNGGISSSQVLHCKQARAFNNCPVRLADGQRTKDPVKERVSMVLPKDRSIGLVRRSGRAGE